MFNWIIKSIIGNKNQRELRRMQPTIRQINEIEQSLDLFKLDVGRYPSDAEGLRALVERPATAQGWTAPYLKKGLPADPWGAPYQYKNPGRNGGPDVFSLGADGKPGGDGDNADIYN